MRFFLSYRRRAEADTTLAQVLHDGLRQRGHEVFIDVDLPVGTDWAAEISARIDWCDFMVVLLSTDSVQSDMVAGEIRLAHYRRSMTGKPRVLPIRLAYDNPLDYELSCYLDRLQYLRWSGPQDSEVILEKLAEEAAQGVQADLGVSRQAPLTTGVVPPEEARPRASADPRLLLKRPGGGIKSTDPFYIRRDADDRVVDAADNVGETVVIKGPRQMGKTSLLNRYREECLSRGKKQAFVDFQIFSNHDLEDYLGLLHQLAASLLRSLDPGTDSGAIPLFTTQQSFDFFVEDHVIRKAGGPVLLAFDEADRLLGRPYQDDFFSLLRAWHNRRSQPNSVWEQVDLALVIATEPYLLIRRADCSPFNVTPSIQLGPFSRSMVDDLNLRYGAPLGPHDLNQLFELLNGQPYLTRLAFFKLKTDASVSSSVLMDRAAAADGPFGEHLRRVLLLLQEHAGLSEALRQVILCGACSDEAYYRLLGAGLVQPRTDGRVVPANLLYARFFKAIR
jgi:hypothetical protein